jgi:lactate dehydrogenase-like 2-hydroxyacid dehydrogenase
MNSLIANDSDNAHPLAQPPGAPHIALFAPYSPTFHQQLGARWHLHHLLPGQPLDALTAQQRAAIRAIVTIGSRGMEPFGFADFPALGLVALTGVGYDAIDVAAARARGIAVSYGPGGNAAAVADHALALLLAAARGIVRSRDGTRPTGLAQLHRKRVGIIGLGHIGKQIARRVGGFDAEVFYHGRSAQPDVPYHYCADPVALAAAVDYLVVCCPGGPATQHLVNADVLRALGPRGFLVNVGRGSIVDTAALVTALRDGTIAGAALDVIEGEPHVEPAVRALTNLVLTPHIASQAPETQLNVLTMLVANLEAFFATGKLVNPVPAVAAG